MKWIRTKDRLPEVNTRVIVSTPGREISVGELLPSGEGGWMYLCEDCTKTDCNIRKLGLVPDKKE